MKYAIISDIHGNIDALNAVVKDAKRKGAKEFFCLGDIVGYGANPSECIQKIWEIKAVCIAGNHDHAAVGLTDISFFNLHAKTAAMWTSEMLSEDETNFLKDLPLVIRHDELTLVHSALDEPAKWHYILNDNDAVKNLELLESTICFIGHSHIPCIFQEQYNSRALFDFLDHLTISQKTIINVGSVGQPRDGDPRSSYVIYDDSTKTIYFERVEYDIEKAQKKILKAGLPTILANRLLLGK